MSDLSLEVNQQKSVLSCPQVDSLAVTDLFNQQRFVLIVCLFA